MNKEKTPEQGVLYLVSTPLGNYDDITIRGKRVLEECDILCCEEERPARRLLSALGLSQKPLLPLHEQNEEEATKEAFQFLQAGKTVALVSDGGSPVFSDPGRLLVRCCHVEGIRVVPLPGANSLIPALQVAKSTGGSFFFAGWLPPQTDERERQLRALRAEHDVPLVIMETPYRLFALLSSVERVCGDCEITILRSLSMDDEAYYHGRVRELTAHFSKKKEKFPFVFVIEGKEKRTGHKKKQKEVSQDKKKRHKSYKKRR